MIESAYFDPPGEWGHDDWTGGAGEEGREENSTICFPWRLDDVSPDGPAFLFKSYWPASVRHHGGLNESRHGQQRVTLAGSVSAAPGFPTRARRERELQASTRARPRHSGTHQNPPHPERTFTAEHSRRIFLSRYCLSDNIK